MKKLVILLCLLLIGSESFCQRRPENQKPEFLIPTPHTRDYKGMSKSLPAKSFYKSKDTWQYIIDTTWGPGLPLNEKLEIFDTYTRVLTEGFDGFNSLGIDMAAWDSIKNVYREKINESTSRGAFSALMSRLAYSLSDGHVFAWDDSVVYTALNPGIPVLLIRVHSAEHFGAILTPLADSTLLVLRAIDDHPLDLQPGDIVLGYEGVPWKRLAYELFEGGLPIFGRSDGAQSAITHNLLQCAGLNWHLFDTIDIIKYDSKDTVHLSVYSLLDLPVSANWDSFELPKCDSCLLNNEQLHIPGIELPEADHFSERSVNYGIIEGTNIGYIYVYIEVGPDQWQIFNHLTDPQFHEAVSSLMSTEGLIIDIRYNLGGWSDFRQSDGLLFNQVFNTLNDVKRCNANDFDLCPTNFSHYYTIDGKPMTLYQRPIAVLIGPHCASMGDVFAHQLSYHPMVHFFGKSSGAFLGVIIFMDEFPGWTLTFSIYDSYHLSQPDIHLNRREFPVDVPVWFNADDVAAGKDPVVNEALEWMDNLAHAHDISVIPVSANPGTDTEIITAQVENPNSHSLSVKAFITSLDSTIIDSVSLADDGSHDDGDPGDGTWGCEWQVPSDERSYSVSITTRDDEAETSRTLPSVVQFTTLGPLTYKEMTFVGDDTIPNPGDDISVNTTLQNNGFTSTVTDVSVTLTSLNAMASFAFTYDNRKFDDISPGELATNKSPFKLKISGDCPVNTEIPIKIEIASKGYIFWADTFSILIQEPVIIEEPSMPIVRIYPNPATDRLHIEFDKTMSQNTSIELMDISGKAVYTEIPNQSTALNHTIDLSAFAEGIYLIKFRNEEYSFTEKVIKVK